MWIWTSFVGILVLVLRQLSELTGSLGLGIILFTIVTRLLLLPLTIKQLQSSKKMQELQPLIQELRRKYGKDQQKFTQEMSKLYKEHKTNPAGSCLPLVIQLPIFIGVYQAVQKLATGTVAADHFSRAFLWLPDLAHKDPYFILPVLSVIFQLLVSVMAMPKIQDPQQKMMSQTMLLMPLFFGYIAFTFNSGAVLYWVMGSILAVVQQFFVSGWGSLTNYLPFLPERTGYLTPKTPLVPLPTPTDDADPVEETKAVAAAPGANFWAPLAKLQTSTVGSEGGTDDIVAANGQRQSSGKKRR